MIVTIRPTAPDGRAARVRRRHRVAIMLARNTAFWFCESLIDWRGCTTAVAVARLSRRCGSGGGGGGCCCCCCCPDSTQSLIALVGAD